MPVLEKDQDLGARASVAEDDVLQKGNEAPQSAKSNRKLKLKTGYWLHFSVGAAVTGLHVSTDLTLK